MKSILNDWRLLVLMSLTLGLAPFYPEPHLIGKIRWIAGGAHGMQTMDWLDAAWHALPWILLIRYVVVRFIFKRNLNAA